MKLEWAAIAILVAMVALAYMLDHWPDHNQRR